MNRYIYIFLFLFFPALGHGYYLPTKKIDEISVILSTPYEHLENIYKHKTVNKDQLSITGSLFRKNITKETYMKTNYHLGKDIGAVEHFLSYELNKYLVFSIGGTLTSKIDLKAGFTVELILNNLDIFVFVDHDKFYKVGFKHYIKNKFLHYGLVFSDTGFFKGKENYMLGLIIGFAPSSKGITNLENILNLKKEKK